MLWITETELETWFQLRQVREGAQNIEDGVGSVTRMSDVKC